MMAATLAESLEKKSVACLNCCQQPLAIINGG
jgi:hypothetical protein